MLDCRIGVRKFEVLWEGATVVVKGLVFRF